MDYTYVDSHNWFQCQFCDQPWPDDDEAICPKCGSQACRECTLDSFCPDHVDESPTELEAFGEWHYD